MVPLHNHVRARQVWQHQQGLSPFLQKYRGVCPHTGHTQCRQRQAARFCDGSDCVVFQVHLILRHKSPKTGEIEEKHLQSPPMVETDKATHVYTAILKPDNTWVADTCTGRGNLITVH